MNLKRTFAFSAFLTLSLWSAVPAPLGTAFTYQGRLIASNSPATGLFDFQVIIFDAASGGIAIATNTLPGAPVTNGLYTINLDFGAAAFNGNARWLAVSTRTNGDPTWTSLTPRQPVSPTPYALRSSFAEALNGLLPDAQLSTNIPRLNGTNVFTSLATFSNASNLFSGTFFGNGSALTGITSTASGPAGGALAGFYPNPAIAIGAITDTNISATANINASKILGGDLAAARLKVGTSHSLLATGATIAGGDGSVVATNAAFASILGGAQARASSYGQHVFANGSFSSPGQAQSSLFILRNATTNATQTELFLDASSQRVLLPVGGNWAVDITIVARSTNNNNVAYTVSGLIWNQGGTLASVMSIPLLRGDSANFAPAGSSDVVVTHDTPHGALVIKVTSPYATALTRWVATVRTTEVVN